MPTSEPYSPGEIQRTLSRIEQTMGALTGSVVTKDELKLHMDGLRQQFKVIDDRHNALAKETEQSKADLKAEVKARQDAEHDREKEQRGFRRSVILCMVAAAAAIVLPLLFRGVGIS